MVLKEIDLPMWSHSDCQNRLSGSSQATKKVQAALRLLFAPVERKEKMLARATEVDHWYVLKRMIPLG